MSTILILMAASAIAGLIIGLKYRILVIGLASAVIAVVAAIAVRDFGLVLATVITVACLLVSQIAYVMGGWLRVRFEGSITQRSNDQIGNDC